jgi:hypothetical protein
MAFKGFTRLVEHGCLHARIALDRHTAIAEDAAAAGQRKRRDQCPLAACIDLNKDIPEPLGLLFDREGSAAKRQAEVDCVHAAPIVEPAMYVEHFFEKVSH